MFRQISNTTKDWNTQPAGGDKNMDTAALQGEIRREYTSP